LKEEILERFYFLTSLEIVKWFRLESLEDSPFVDSPTPHSFKFPLTKEEGTSIYVEISSALPKSKLVSVKSEFSPPPTLPFSKPPSIQITFSPVKTCTTSPKTQIPPFPNQMEGINSPENRMDAIVVARYASLVLLQPMNSLIVGDYLKYKTKFTREEDITTKEHLVAFYSYADNLNIENEDVWMRDFVQILDG
jgi:hypothetical protein